jgi:DNA repair protein SbcC/Rad50
VRLHALRLQNFRQHVDSVIEFSGGITGIIGPNGAGKTTILEAIAWALYGMDAARGKRDSIKFSRAGARASVRVELDFDLAGHRYRIVRGLTTAEVYLDGGAAPVANSISAVNDLVARRVGMTRAEFFNTYFTGQKELAVMAALGPTERAQFLSRVLGYERLRAAQELARGRRRDLHAELAGVEQAMPDEQLVARRVAEATEAAAQAVADDDRAATRLLAATAALAEHTLRWDEAQVAQQAHAAAVSDLRLRDAAFAERGREELGLVRAVEESVEASAQRDALRAQLAPYAGLLAEREQLDRLAVAAGRREAVQSVVRDADEEVARREERRALLATAPALEESLTAQLEAARRAWQDTEQRFERAQTDWVRDRQEAETKRDALRSQYAELRAQRDRIVEAGEAGLCPTCQQPIGANYRTLLDTIDTQMEVVKVDGNYWKGRVAQLAERPASLVQLDAQRREEQTALTALDRKLDRTRQAAKELDALLKEIARLAARAAAARAELAALPEGYDRARHEQVRAEVERLRPLEQTAARLGAAADALAERTQALETVRRTVAAMTAELALLRERVAAGEATAAAWRALEATLRDARAEHQAAEVAAARAASARTAAADALARAEASAAERARLAARRLALSRERRMHDELDRAYADLRSDLNAAVRPELSELASRFLGLLTDGRYDEFELDEQYQLVVVEDGLPKPVISGGEEDLANLVLRLAISQMIAERAGQSFSLLILDEIFGSLDDARRQNVVELLRRLHDRFEQVILITHIESVRDGCDQVLTVQYDPRSGGAVVAAGEDAVTVGGLA